MQNSFQQLYARPKKCFFPVSTFQTLCFQHVFSNSVSQSEDVRGNSAAIKKQEIEV